MNTFQEIIKFAINTENEAAEFYRDMQNRSMHSTSKQFFQELEAMERGHAKMLESFTIDNISTSFSEPVINDLQISDYMDEIEIRNNLSFQEVLIIAMKREESAMKMYQDLANRMSNENTKNIFLRLAGEESKHKHQLESVYDDEILKEN